MNDYLKERDLWWPVSPELMTSYRDGSHTDDWLDGTLLWFKNGVWHRDGDKPARIYAANSTLLWYKNGKIHRDGDKPAAIFWNGTLWWYKNGKQHRVTGPAVINRNNKHEYWINGVNITAKVNAWLKTRDYLHPFTLEQQVEYTLTFS